VLIPKVEKALGVREVVDIPLVPRQCLGAQDGHIFFRVNWIYAIANFGYLRNFITTFNF
jgi:hypothetical protein